jgi:MOSC domain-containing protein YiiM
VLDFSFRFDPWFDGLPASPKQGGTVRRCVIRTGRGQRSLEPSVELSPERGVHGDSWIHHPHAAPGNQVALINVHLIDALAGGSAEKAALAGDNLHVDLDLSEANLPVGTRLKIGTTVLVVSGMLHRPCRSFIERFGAVAAKKVARATRRGLRGRGVLCSIERGGVVQVGDAIGVERPVMRQALHEQPSPGH